jgi:hypothetical protein
MEKDWHRPDGKGLSAAAQKSRIRWRRNTLMSRGHQARKAEHSAAQLATANACDALPE